MQSPHRHTLRFALAVVLGWAQIMPAAAAPAQEPLLGRSGKPITPNIMFTLDDSGSMAWNYMPDSAGSNNQRMHPSEPTAQHGYAMPNVIGTRAQDWYNGRLRSSIYNAIYYNPEVRYMPWTLVDGTLMPDSPPNAAPVHPNLAWGTADLTQKITYTGTVCHATLVNGGARTCPSVTDEEIDPAVYYNYVGPARETLTTAQWNTQMTRSGNFERVIITEHASFNRGPGRTDCTPVSDTQRFCSQAQELQNFANWFTYNRTRHGQAVTGISAAFVDLNPELRVGYARINQGARTVDGVAGRIVVRGVRPFDGTDKANFYNWLLTTNPSGNTPLPAAYDGVGKYFERADNAGPWGHVPGTNNTTPHLQCRKSYQIMMTDGIWSGLPPTAAAQQNVDALPGPVISGPGGQSYQYLPSAPFQDKNSAMLADVAMYYWNRDLRPDLPNRIQPSAQDPSFWQNLVTFTVGMGVDGNLRYPDDYEALVDGVKTWSTNQIDDLWHTAINSRGRYLSARSGEELREALRSVLGNIATVTGSIAGVSVNGRILQVGSRKYTPSYQTQEWIGEISASAIDITGTSSGEIWKASEQIPAHADRNIIVGTASTSPRAALFTWSALTPAMKTALGANASEDLVNYLRGDQSKESVTFRTRASRLGDIVNSGPIYVKGSLNKRYHLMPDGTAGRDTYADFVEAKKSRPGMVFAGANDGMLHAFRESDGREVLAYVPNSVLPNLALLASPAYEHRYYVDGPLVEADAWLGGAWRNLLLGSTGAGSRAAFALDITNMSAPGTGNLKWEFSNANDSNVGYLLSPIETGRMANGQWVAIFGNGYDSNAGKASLFIVNLDTGALIKRVDTGVGSTTDPNGLGGVRLILDGQQTVIGAYAGDLQGNVWKFDLAGSTAASWKVAFGGQPLFTATRGDGTAQAITAPPEVIAHPRGGYMVLVGTGKLFEDGDQATTTAETLYGLWDKQKLHEVSENNWAWSTEGRITSASLIKTGSVTQLVTPDEYYTVSMPDINWDSDRGWALPQSMVSGQRLIARPQLLTGLVLFETMAPNGNDPDSDPCAAVSGASGYTVLIDPVSGKMSDSPTLDINGDGTIDSSDTIIGGWRIDSWGGASVILRDPPRQVCVSGPCPPAPPAGFCPNGYVRSNLQNTGAGGTNVCVAVPPPQRWWWRQVSIP